MKETVKQFARWLTILALLAAIAWAGATIFGKVTYNRGVAEHVAEEEEGWAAYHKHQALATQYPGWSICVART